MSSQLLISSHTSQQEKMCGQGELVNLASINLQLGTKKQMNYRISKNDEVADLLLPYILANLVLYSKFELYICYQYLNFFPKSINFYYTGNSDKNDLFFVTWIGVHVTNVLKIVLEMDWINWIKSIRTWH